MASTKSISTAVQLETDYVDSRPIEQPEGGRCCKDNAGVVDWIEAVGVHFITRSAVKIENLNGYARRLHQHVHESAHSHVFNFTHGRLNMRPTIALQRLVDERLELFRMLLNPGACEQLGES
jgi:hypothetical protein